MKVIALNGSPRKEGNTYQALNLVCAELEKEGIEVEILQVGDKVLRGCMSCGGCSRNKDKKCVINDGANEIIKKMVEADGMILGSPVHFANIGGTMKSFLDRAFYVSSSNGGLFKNKVGASVVAVRRSGGSFTFNGLNNYLTYGELQVPTSNYWNIIHGAAEGEALKDAEGCQIMRVLGKNMAWLLKSVKDSEKELGQPEKEKKIFTNFIR